MPADSNVGTIDRFGVINGSNTPLTPGTKLEYEMPDMYGRPWAKIWAESFEQGMTPPEDNSEDIFNFENNN